MPKAKGAAGRPDEAFAVRLLGYLGIGSSAAVATGCAVLAILGAARGGPGGCMLLWGLLFLPVAGLGVAEFLDFLRLRDWSVAPEVPLGVKLLGHLGRILGSLAMAACVALVVLTIACPGSVPPFPARAAGETASVAPRPLLATVLVLGVFIAMLVRVVGSAISELRTWARPGALVVTGLAVALLTVALVFNLTVWGIAEAKVAIPVFLGISVILFLFLLVYLMLPPVVEAFESRRL